MLYCVFYGFYRALRCFFFVREERVQLVVHLWNYMWKSIRLSWRLNKKFVRHSNQRIVCVYVTLTVRKLLCNWFHGNVAEEEGSVSVVRINTAHHSHHCPLRADMSNQYNCRGQMSAPLLLPWGSENVIKLLSLYLLRLILPCNAVLQPSCSVWDSRAILIQ